MSSKYGKKTLPSIPIIIYWESKNNWKQLRIVTLKSLDSSSSVYGDTDNLPMKETNRLQPQSYLKENGISAGIYYPTPLQRTDECVIALPGKDIVDETWMCQLRLPRGINELEVADLTSFESKYIKPPSIKECNKYLTGGWS